MKQIAINSLATVVKINLSKPGDMQEIVVDFRGGDINRLVQAACKLIPGEKSEKLKRLSSKVFMKHLGNSVMGSLVTDKKGLLESGEYIA